MTIEELKEQLTSSLPPLFQCDALGENRFRVRTPLIFPDGGVVDVFVSKSDDLYTVTDYGDAMGWLDMRSAATGIAPKQRSLVADACRTHGIEIEGGHVMLRRISASDLAQSIMRVAQAEACVGDVWFTMPEATRMSQDMRSPQVIGNAANPRSSEDSTASDVDAWLRGKDLQIERKYRVKGVSEQTWSVDFRTRSPAGESLVFLLSARTRTTARRRVNEVVTAWFDLGGRGESHSQPAFISLFDDTTGAWRDEDFNLLKQQSNVAFWSRKDELERLLATNRPNSWN